MDLATVSTIIGSTASLLSAFFLYYFTQHFPWDISRKNVMRILFEQSSDFKEVIQTLRKNARHRLGSEYIQRGVFLGILLPIIITIFYLLIYWNEIFSGNSPTFSMIVFVSLVWAYVIWILMLLITYFVFAFKDEFLYPVSMIYLGSSLVFVVSLGITTLSSNSTGSAGRFFVVYVIVLGTIMLLKWGISRKEDKIIKENWHKLYRGHKNILLRVYTQDGREFIGILENVFDSTWLQLRGIDSGGIVNIEWRTIKGVEVVRDDS